MTAQDLATKPVWVLLWRTVIAVLLGLAVTAAWRVEARFATLETRLHTKLEAVDSSIEALDRKIDLNSAQHHERLQWLERRGAPPP